MKFDEIDTYMFKKTHLSKRFAMTKKQFQLLYAVKRAEGIRNYKKLSVLAGVSVGFISEMLKEFQESGLVDKKGITAAGLEVLEPYKVRGAIIMAAGMSSRFVPISLEKPKGLLVVKGEVLIERQIRQLKEAGIERIALVLGYKKEAFFYLEDKFNVKIFINPEYNVKNNIETIYCAREYAGNSYICSSDDYFSENVFEEYVYQSYYAAVHVHEKTNEWYMIPDSGFHVKKVEKSGEDGYIMLGHVYWDREFAKQFVKLICEHRELGDYDANLWEDLFADNIRKLPPMEIKVYPGGVIHEFDSLNELREFDDQYVKHSHSRILENICRVFTCEESDILSFKPIKEGITNTSFAFEVKGKRYVYRHPRGETEKLISRQHEKISLETAKKSDVDPTFLYMDGDEGWKISKYIEGGRYPDYRDREDTKRVIQVMRRLHDKKYRVDWEFLPWEEACRFEKLLRAGDGIFVTDFEDLKAGVERCYRDTLDDEIEKRFCHCDTYASNWILTEDETILIDWEYAGNADPGCDVGCYIMDAMYEVDEAIRFIKEYCGEFYNDKLIFHYLAYVAVISYHWFMWALYREACGTVMGDSLHNWYVMAKRYSGYLSGVCEGEKAKQTALPTL